MAAKGEPEFTHFVALKIRWLVGLLKSLSVARPRKNLKGLCGFVRKSCIAAQEKLRTE
jgi:hypothetical protein